MAIDFVMPKLAMAMNEGTVSEWLVEEGQKIEKGQPLASVETEKVAYDIESPEAGYFHIVVPTGETVPVEVMIGKFAESEGELVQLQASGNSGSQTSAVAPEAVEQPSLTASTTSSPAAVSTTPTAPQRSPGERIKVSPLARKMAADNQLALAHLKGTGPEGRIVKRDILEALERGVSIPAAMATGPLLEKARIPMKGIRATIANRMMESLQSTAQLSSFWESDITELLRVRKTFVAKAEQLGTKVSVNAFLIKAIAYAVKQVPIANSRLEGEEIVIYDNINMGIAIALPGQTEFDSALMVPVLKNVDRLGVVEIDRQMKDLVQRTREGSLSAEDMSDCTITLSSTAGIAPPGLQTTPVLNLPNAALVGPSTPQDKPVIHNGEVAVRTIMPISFTFDHRIIDGEPAARFMKALHECLENPELMLA